MAKEILCCFLFFLLANYCATQSILTNSVSYNKTSYQMTWVSKTPPTTPAEGLLGQVNSVTMSGGYVYMLSSTGIIKYNPQRPPINSTSYLISIPNSVYISGLSAPLVIGNQLYVGSTIPPIGIARFNTTDLSMLNQGQPNMIIQEQRIGPILASYLYSGKIYFVGRTGVTQYSQDLTTSTLWLSNQQKFVIKSVAFDSTNGAFYLGGSNGVLWKLLINTGSFGSSVLDTLQLSDNSTDITAIVTDTTNGYVYAANKGSSSAPAICFRVQISNFAQTSNVTFSKFDYSVTSGVLDPTGVLYFTTSQIPGRVIQIDLQSFHYEVSVQFPNTVGGFYSSYFDTANHLLHLGGSSALLYTQYVQAIPADACLNDCSGNGLCIYPRACICSWFTSYSQNLTYAQPWCAYKQCAFNCHGNGVCSPFGLCICNQNFTGALCDIPQCPSNCSEETGNGVCQYDSNNKPLQCNCNSGWAGIDCKTSTTHACSLYTDCSGCTSAPGCGWCGDNNKCFDGTVLGALDGTGCRLWHYQECPAGAEVINYLFVAFGGILMLVNMITFVMYNTQDDIPPIRTEWYRFQRSCKAWSMVFQLQYIAITGLLNVKLPTIFLSFTSFWNWIVFAWGLPWLAPSTHATERSLLNVDQYQFFANADASSIFVGILFWWGVVWGAGLLAWVLMAVIVSAKGRDDSSIVLQTSPLYISTRVLDFAFMGIVTYAGAQVVTSGASGGMIALAVILLAVIGLGYPVFVFAASFVVGKKLWKKWTRMAFFPVVGSVQVVFVKWMSAPIFKRFFLGVVWGLLSVNAITQLVLNLVVQIVYLIINVAVQPYIDVLQRNLEIFLSIVNTLSSIVLFGFLHPGLTTQGNLAITVIYIILQVTAVFGIVVFYFMSWIQMHQIFTMNQLWLAITCRYKEDESSGIALNNRN